MWQLSWHDYLERQQVGQPSGDLELEDGHPSYNHGMSPPSTKLYQKTHLICKNFDCAANPSGELVPSHIFVPQ